MSSLCCDAIHNARELHVICLRNKVQFYNWNVNFEYVTTRHKDILTTLQFRRIMRGSTLYNWHNNVSGIKLPLAQLKLSQWVSKETSCNVSPKWLYFTSQETNVFAALVGVSSIMNWGAMREWDGASFNFAVCSGYLCSKVCCSCEFSQIYCLVIQVVSV